jgi:hypothetical protein
VRVLHLDRDFAAVVETGAVDLSDRGRGGGIGLELGKQIAESIAEVLLDHFAHVLERCLARAVAELAQLGLKRFQLVGWESAQVQH